MMDVISERDKRHLTPLVDWSILIRVRYVNG